MKKISIIIPCPEIDSLTEKCIQECLKLDYDDFEIIVLPDEEDEKISEKYADRKLRIIGTGRENTKPSFKRNIGMREARGDFFAFIDADAYPRKDWLRNTIKYFKDEKVGIVGGPNLTPHEGNFWEKVSGYSLSNFLVSGHAAIRYKISKTQFVTELPSCNYIVRKNAASEYDPKFLTAEDTKFCFNARKKRFKILYARDVIVYHHRRNTLSKHLKQMVIYGRDNIWLMKREFSRNKSHLLITSLGLLGFLGGIVLSLFYPLIRDLFLIIVGVYLISLLFTSIKENLRTTFWVFVVSAITPFLHGFGSLYGLFKKQKVE